MNNEIYAKNMVTVNLVGNNSDQITPTILCSILYCFSHLCRRFALAIGCFAVVADCTVIDPSKRKQIAACTHVNGQSPKCRPYARARNEHTTYL